MTEIEDATSLDRWEIQLRKGGLGLAVLASLWRDRAYGLEILRRLEEVGLSVPEGTIYPLLSRLRAEGALSSEWVEAEAGHPRKYYSLTEDGRRQAADMARSWALFASGVEALLGTMQKESKP